MKTIVLGDIHGRANWKEIILRTHCDRVVFIGDYFDTHEDISAALQIHNFKEIIEAKKQGYPEMILLIGNHDYHYFPGIEERYSGYSDWSSIAITEVLRESKEHLQMCHIQDDLLMTHAGVTKTWAERWNLSEFRGFELQTAINELFNFKPRAFSFRENMGEYHDMYGDDITQSPIWVRPRSLHKDAIDGYDQVVGHTTMRKLVPETIGTTTFYHIDTLGTSGEFLVIDNGIITHSI
jgi:predicted phosphodiesterase